RNVLECLLLNPRRRLAVFFSSTHARTSSAAVREQLQVTRQRALWREHHSAPGNHVSHDLWRVYRIGSTVTGLEGRRRAAVRAASVSVGNDSASFSGPQAAEGNPRVSQTECPPGYVTRITNMGKSPLACNSTAAPVHDLETIAWRRRS